ncbi:MAG: hypothetical protein WCC11_11280 [Gammaproteobacteria bacterium]
MALSFTAGQTITSLQQPCTMATGDICGNSVNDLVIFDRNTLTVNVLLNDRSRNFILR